MLEQVDARTVRPISWSVLLAWMSATACGADPIAIEYSFVDDATRAQVRELHVLAFEPLSDVDGVRSLVRCADVGAFGPTARLSFDKGRLTGLQPTIAPATRALPLEADWRLSASDLLLSDAVNPWQAVLVLLSGRGEVRPDAARTSAPATMATVAQGCRCFRMKSDAAGSDPTLDAEVKAHCEAVEKVSPVHIELGSIVPKSFELQPCGTDEHTVIAGQVQVAQPGVCVRVARSCSENCFSCATERCDELLDISGVPIRASVQPQTNAMSVVGPVTLTDVAGQATPFFRAEDCSSERKWRFEILGRKDEAIEFPLNCVRNTRFVDRSQLLFEDDSRIVGMSALSLDAIQQTPERLVVLSNPRQGSGAMLTVVERNLTGTLSIATSSAARTRIADEIGVQIRGYFDEPRGTPSSSQGARIAVLTRTADPARQTWLRLFRFQEQTRTLVELRRMRVGCGSSTKGCVHPPSCSAVPSNCEFVPSTSPVSLSFGDVDRDGFTDVNVAATEPESRVTTYVSNGQSVSLSRGYCQCVLAHHGSGPHEFVAIGGPNAGADKQGTALVLGAGSGAYIRYADDRMFEGQSCTPPGGGCPLGLECVEACRGIGRCLKPCTSLDGCDAQHSECQPIASQSPNRYCVGRAQSCNHAPANVWPLTAVEALISARFREEGYDDLVILGRPNAAQAFGVTRILFGSPFDLTRLQTLSPEVQRSASTELFPRISSSHTAVPKSAVVGDFNADGHQDLAVLYPEVQAIHVWLGSKNRAPQELDGPVSIPTCSGDYALVASDLDGDRATDLVVACTDSRTDRGRIAWYQAAPK